jgi:dTDP-4-amino-4,6-dideoxygalactose transaminase
VKYMKVPFADLRLAYLECKAAIDAAVERVFQSGYYIGGPELAAFEEAFATVAECGTVSGVANGTDAISLALRATDLPAGARVAVTAVSAYPSTVGIVRGGYVPFYIDIDPASGLMDLDALARNIDDIDAVLLVHLYGSMPDMERLSQICAAHNVPIVEDCAQAMGASYAGKPAGTWGRAAAWSFYPTKNLGAIGDAGAVSALDPAIAEKVRQLRNYGMRNHYEVTDQGWNARLDPLQAAILAAKLPTLMSQIECRRQLALRYDEAFAPLNQLTTPSIDVRCQPARHLYPVLLPPQTNRDAFQTHLAARGVATLIHYQLAMTAQPATQPTWRNGNTFPHADDFCARVVSLPLFPGMTDAQQAHVVSTVSFIFSGA